MVQKAVSIAIDKGKRFESGSHFIAWLVTTVKHCAMNHRRKTAGRKTVPSDPSVLSMVQDESTLNQNLDPIDAATGELLPDQQSFDDRVIRALQSLVPDMRSCLLLRVLLNLSYAEISSLMQIPEGTAMSHVHRGKKKLRTTLGKNGDGNGGGV